MNRKRIDITLSVDAIKTIDKNAHESRSRFIEKAVTDYIKRLEEQKLKNKLKKGYLATTEESLKIADEWTSVENQIWSEID